MFEVIDGYAPNVVAVRAVGTISAADYADVLAPALDDATSGGAKARFLIELGPEFTGYAASGIAADAGLGLGHLAAFERIAVVTDVHWIRDAIGIFGRFIPGDVRLFAMAEAPAAEDWIRS